MKIELDTIARVLTEFLPMGQASALLVAMLPDDVQGGVQERLALTDAPPSDLLTETIPIPGANPTLPSAPGCVS